MHCVFNNFISDWKLFRWWNNVRSVASMKRVAKAMGNHSLLKTGRKYFPLNLYLLSGLFHAQKALALEETTALSQIPCWGRELDQPYVNKPQPFCWSLSSIFGPSGLRDRPMWVRFVVEIPIPQNKFGLTRLITWSWSVVCVRRRTVTRSRRRSCRSPRLNSSHTNQHQQAYTVSQKPNLWYIFNELQRFSFYINKFRCKNRHIIRT